MMPDTPPLITNSSARYIRSLNGGRISATASATVTASAAKMLTTKASRRCALRSGRAGAGSAFKAVTYAPHGDEIARLRRVGLDLLAQPAQVDRDGGGVAVEFLAPDAVKELGAGEDLVRMPR